MIQQDLDFFAVPNMSAHRIWGEAGDWRIVVLGFLCNCCFSWGQIEPKCLRFKSLIDRTAIGGG